MKCGIMQKEWEMLRTNRDEVELVINIVNVSLVVYGFWAT